jgi:uncharacterized membrane protein
MKRNTFYLIVGCVAVILLAIFWYSDETHEPLLISIGIVVAVSFLYLVRKRVKDFVEDERAARITEKAALRTLQVFWVLFCAFSIGAIAQILHEPSFPPREFFPSSQLHPPEALHLRSLGYIQLGLLCLTIFLYVGFRFYYARKYGEWETDEE